MIKKSVRTIAILSTFILSIQIVFLLDFLWESPSNASLAITNFFQKMNQISEPVLSVDFQGVMIWYFALIYLFLFAMTLLTFYTDANKDDHPVDTPIARTIILSVLFMIISLRSEALSADLWLSNLLIIFLLCFSVGYTLNMVALFPIKAMTIKTFESGYIGGHIDENAYSHSVNNAQEHHIPKKGRLKVTTGRGEVPTLFVVIVLIIGILKLSSYQVSIDSVLDIASKTLKSDYAIGLGNLFLSMSFFCYFSFRGGFSFLATIHLVAFWWGCILLLLAKSIL